MRSPATVYGRRGVRWKSGYRAYTRMMRGQYATRWSPTCAAIPPFGSASSGRATRLVGTTTDITAHKQADLAAASARLRWQFALEGGNHGLWDWDVRDNTVFFSPRWKAMLGFAADEVGDGLDEWKDRVHPDDLPAAIAALTAHFDGL